MLLVVLRDDAVRIVVGGGEFAPTVHDDGLGVDVRAVLLLMRPVREDQRTVGGVADDGTAEHDLGLRVGDAADLEAAVPLHAGSEGGGGLGGAGGLGRRHGVLRL